MPINRRPVYLLAAAIAVLTFAVFLPSLHHQFIDWDDGTYIFDNPHLRALNSDFFRWAFFRFYSSNWHPLTWLSHGVDWAIWGANPLGHHLGNILLHAINTGIVTVLAYRLITVIDENRPKPESGTGWISGPMLAAGVAGILFGTHPIHVESVAWASERKDLLCALFFMLAVLAYLQAASARSVAVAGQTAPWYSRNNILCTVFFVLALLSKPMALTLPIVLVIIDWFPLGQINSLRQGVRAIAAKLPLCALSLGSAIVTVLAQKSGGSISSLTFIPITARLAVAGTSLLTYFGKMLLPVHLVPFYPYPAQDALFTFTTFAAIAAVLGISLFCIMKARTNRLWLALWAYYVATLFPVIGIVQVGRQAMADRYAYLPGIALFLLVGLAAAWVVEHWEKGRRLVVAVTLVTAVGLGGLTVQQQRIWQDSITLWTFVISSTPRELDFAYNNRAIAWHRLGQLDKSEADFGMAIRIKPDNGSYFNNRGILLITRHRYDEAMSDFEKAIARNSVDSLASYNVACIYALRNDVPQSCTWLGRSIDQGYNHWQEIKADHDLDTIRSAACYQEIMAGK